MHARSSSKDICGTGAEFCGVGCQAQYGKCVPAAVPGRRRMLMEGVGQVAMQ